MQLYNTLTRSKTDFEPIEAGHARLYTCGPTVYDHAHIGNLRSFLFYDTLRRTLEANGYKVEHVMNITDVGHLVSDADEGEDKLEKGAAREGKTVWEVADFYTKAFEHDIKLVNILPPSINPKRSKNSVNDPYARATDFIPEQINIVQTLLDNGFAYQTKQAIYFDITKLANYGQLTGQSISDKETAVREEVITDPDKTHPHDFAVWFFTVGHFKDHVMRWNSPWGEGFPGWHLECSAIIHALLGDPIDIHTGGIDHIGTHHPNEMAQTEAAFGHQLANIWLHNEFMLVESSKMSKSKGNFYRLKDVTDKGFSPLAFRLLCLQAHYRSELNFTWDSVQAAQNFLVNLNAWADLQFQATPGQANPDFAARLRGTLANMASSLNDDLGTPACLAHLSQLVDWMKTAPLPERDLEEFKNALAEVDQMLGLDLSKRQDITKNIRQLIEHRELARQNENYTEADNLRQQLSDLDIDIDDTPYGPRWRRQVI